MSTVLNSYVFQTHCEVERLSKFSHDGVERHRPGPRFSRLLRQICSKACFLKVICDTEDIIQTWPSDVREENLTKNLKCSSSEDRVPNFDRPTQPGMATGLGDLRRKRWDAGETWGSCRLHPGDAASGLVWPKLWKSKMRRKFLTFFFFFLTNTYVGLLKMSPCPLCQTVRNHHH